MNLSTEKLIQNLVLLYQNEVLTKKEFDEKLDKILKNKKKEIISEEMILLHLEECFQANLLIKEELEAKKKGFLKMALKINKIQQEPPLIEPFPLENSLELSDEELVKIFDENLNSIKEDKELQELRRYSKEEKIKFVKKTPQKKKNSAGLISTLLKSIYFINNNQEEKVHSPSELPMVKDIPIVKEDSPIPSSPREKKEEKKEDGGSNSSVFTTKERLSTFLSHNNRKFSTFLTKTFTEPKVQKPTLRPNLKISAPVMIEEHPDGNPLNDQEMSAIIVKMSQSLDEKARQNILDLKKEQKILMVQLQKEKEEKIAKEELKLQSQKAQTINRDYQGVILNFMSILTVQDMQDSFLKHLESESNKEPLEFFIEYDKLQKKINIKNLQLFFQIVNDYIRIGSKKELNISGSSRSRLLKKIENMDEHNWSLKENPKQIIEEIRQEIFSDLKLDSFPRFIQSDIGYETICRNKDNPLVVSKNPASAVLFKLQKSFHGSNEEDIEGIDFSVISEKLSNPKLFKENYLNTKNLDPSELKNFSVKLLIVGNNRQSALDLGIRGYLSSIFSNTSRGELYHTALMVGSFYFEWDENELCLPKILPPEISVISEDLDTILTLKNIDENLHLLAKTICKWNVKKSYLKHEKDKTIGGNSQDFIESLLEGMGIETQLTIPVQEFLKNLKEKGITDLEFKMDKNFRNKFKIKEKMITFETHKQLDEFTKKFFKIDERFTKNHYGEYQLLRLFDRAFWLKHSSVRSEILKKNDRLTQITKDRLNAAVNKADNYVNLIEQLTIQIKDLERDLKALNNEEKKLAPLQREVDDESFDDCPYQNPIRKGSFYVLE